MIHTEVYYLRVIRAISFVVYIYTHSQITLPAQTDCLLHRRKVRLSLHVCERYIYIFHITDFFQHFMCNNRWYVYCFTLWVI